MFKRLGASPTIHLTRALAVAIAVMSPLHDAVSGPNAKSVLHLEFKTSMAATPVDADARGTVAGQLHRQGNVYHQSLVVALSSLDPNTPYELWAAVGEDPNIPAILIDAFDTDRRGKARLAYAKRGAGQGIGRHDPLPDALDPIATIRELFVIDQDTEVVLQADVTDAEKWQYLDLRRMNNTGVIPAAAGNLRLKGNQRRSQLRLEATGLVASASYRLVIDEVIYAPTYTADARGRLVLRALPVGAPDIRTIRTIALIDADDAAVLVSGGLGSVQTSLPLGAAAAFAVLAGSTVTNTGPTVVTGDLGVSPGSAVVGFPPGTVVGTQHVTDLTAAQAQLDLTTAYNDAAGRTLAPVSVAGNLGGQTLAPGLYKSTGSLEISSGDLTLDAQGDANAVFIFQIATTLMTTSGRQVVLIGGAKAANIYWQVGTSATLGTTTVFKGTIMADQAITLLAGATLEGRALARITAVALEANAVTLPEE